MSKAGKSRYWAFVVYPESAPWDWAVQLQQTGLRCAISPLHNCDADPNGEVKKEHWHVIACWDGPTTYAAAKSLTDRLNAPIPQALNSVKGYYRYFTHKDNPDKHQYDDSAIQHINGFDPSDFLEWTRSELEKMKREVLGLIRERALIEYADIIEQLADEGRTDLLSVTMNNTVFFRAYMESRRHRLNPAAR